MSEIFGICGASTKSSALLWQVLVLLLCLRFAHWSASERIAPSWWAVVFWLILAATLLGMPIALSFPWVLAGFPGVSWLIWLPKWLEYFGSEQAAFAFVGLAWFVHLALQRERFVQGRNFLAPTRSRLAAICRFWRELPDQDSLQFGQLNYPEVRDANSAAADHRSGSPAEAQLADQIHQALARSRKKHASLFLDRLIWRRLRIVANVLLLFVCLLAAFVIALSWPIGQESKSFAHAFFLAFVPAGVSVCFAGRGMKHGCLDIWDLFRICVRSLLLDCGLGFVLHLPVTLFLCWFTGDWFWPSLHLGISLVVTTLLFLLVPLAVHLQFEGTNFLAAWFSLWLSGFLLMALQGVVDAWILPLPEPTFAFGAIGLAVFVGLYGWDRMVRHLHPLVEAWLPR